MPLFVFSLHPSIYNRGSNTQVKTNPPSSIPLILCAIVSMEPWFLTHMAFWPKSSQSPPNGIYFTQKLVRTLRFSAPLLDQSAGEVLIDVTWIFTLVTLNIVGSRCLPQLLLYPRIFLHYNGKLFYIKKGFCSKDFTTKKVLH